MPFFYCLTRQPTGYCQWSDTRSLCYFGIEVSRYGLSIQDCDSSLPVWGAIAVFKRLCAHCCNSWRLYRLHRRHLCLDLVRELPISSTCASMADVLCLLTALVMPNLLHQLLILCSQAVQTLLESHTFRGHPPQVPHPYVPFPSLVPRMYTS
jgi:hypothetical protein